MAEHPKVASGVYEVNAPALDMVAEIAAAFGVPFERLTYGLQVELEAGRRSRGCSWNTFARVCDRLAATGLTPAQLQTAGARFAEVPSMRAFSSIAGLVLSPGMMYWAAATYGGPRLFRVLTPRSRRSRRARFASLRNSGKASIPAPPFITSTLGSFVGCPRSSAYRKRP